MIDLLAHGEQLGTHNGKVWIEIPSASFVAMCEETIREKPDTYPPT